MHKVYQTGISTTWTDAFLFHHDGYLRNGYQQIDCWLGLPVCTTGFTCIRVAFHLLFCCTLLNLRKRDSVAYSISFLA
jgi:hypothetical protein